MIIDGVTIFDITSTWGSDSNGLPFFDIIINNEHYNIMGFLGDNVCYNLISWLKGVVGIVAVLICIMNNIKQVNLIIHGMANLGSSQKFDPYIIDTTNMLETHGGDMIG